MGNFYANFTVRCQEPTSVAQALAGRNAVVTPATKGCVVVFEETSDAFDLQATAEIGEHLSRTLQCAVLAVSNYDDDVLIYQLFESGKQIDTYDSCPGYFEGPPSLAPGETAGGVGRLLCAAFGANNPEIVDTILRAPEGDGGYAFAVDRHHDLIAALRLPDFGVGIGYRYLAQGELPEGLSAEELLRAPEQAGAGSALRPRSVLGLECWLKDSIPGLPLLEARDFFVARLGEGGGTIPRPILATNVVKVDFAGVAGKGKSLRPLLEESVVAPLHPFVNVPLPFVTWQDPQQGLEAVRDVLAKLAAGWPSGASEPLNASQRQSLQGELRALEQILIAAAQAGTQFLLVHEE